MRPHDLNLFLEDKRKSNSLSKYLGFLNHKLHLLGPVLGLCPREILL